MKHVLAFALSVPLVLSACGGTDVPVPVAQPQAVRGTLQSNFVSGAAVNLFAGSSLLSAGTVAGTGAFTVALPSASAVEPYLSSSDADLTAVGSGCSGLVTDSAPGARAFGFNTLVSNGVLFDTSVVTATSSTSATARAFLWLYSDRARTLSGSVTCRDGSGSSTERYDASIQSGWNLLRLDGTVSVTGSTYAGSAVLTVVADQATTWGPSVLAQGVSAQSFAAHFREERVWRVLMR